jgi:eukaryotic-like serine/threonine-protein kinase
MELLIGETVEAFAQRKGGALSLDELLPLLDATLDVLAAAHAVGTVHRDIKPENLFLTRDGTLKVLDFGLARVKEATTQARLTVAGVAMGTPAFMPPEQALAKWDEVTTRSDVYAVGASIWNLLTGQFVHDGDTVPQLLVAVSTQPARPIRTLLPQLPLAFANVVDRSLAFNSADRWADAGEMHRALRSAVSGADRQSAGVPLAAVGYAATLNMPGLAESMERALLERQASPTSVRDPVPVSARQTPLGTLPSAPLTASDARPGVSIGTGTVAPVSSDPGAARRRKSSVVLIGFAATVILLGTMAAAALFYAHEKRIDLGSLGKAASSASADSVTHYIPSASETASAAVEPPSVTPGPSAQVAGQVPTSNASALPASTGSASASKSSKSTPTKPTTKVTPKKPPPDPLGTYR